MDLIQSVQEGGLPIIRMPIIEDVDERTSAEGRAAERQSTTLDTIIGTMNTSLRSAGVAGQSLAAAAG